MASIVILSLGGRGDLLPDICHRLGEETATVGREESCEIQVLDGQVSRRHCEVEYDATVDGYRIGDLGSANGTLVEGVKISRKVPLRDGDIIEIGDSRLRFTTKDFKDRQSAIAHFRRMGERQRGTLIR